MVNNYYLYVSIPKTSIDDVEKKLINFTTKLRAVYPTISFSVVPEYSHSNVRIKYHVFAKSLEEIELKQISFTPENFEYIVKKPLIESDFEFCYSIRKIETFNL